MSERWRRVLTGLDTLEPSPDVWDHAVTRSEGVPPTDVRADGQRRILSLVVAVVVAAGGVAIALFALGRLGTVSGAGGLATYRDPTGAWEIAYPDRFLQGSIPQPSHPRVIPEGIWIANWYSPRFHSETGSPILSEHPNEGVVVFVSQSFGGALYLPGEPDSTFPVTLEDLEVIPGPSPGDWRGDAVVGNGESYLIRVRILPGASKEDRQAAEQIVSSFRILPLEEGAVTGKHSRFFVLGPPDRYPMGSVTRFGASSLPQEELSDRVPFYLVHVPDGFYALAWPADLVGGYQDCDITYEPDSREFTCPNGARWALDGSVIAKPDPELPGDPLRVLLVRISLDGHVLVSPNVFMSETELDLKLT